jgi:GNAT superfamily N-acetyltransferase
MARHNSSICTNPDDCFLLSCWHGPGHRLGDDTAHVLARANVRHGPAQRAPLRDDGRWRQLDAHRGLGDIRPMDIVRIRSAVPDDLPAVRRVFRRSSLSNEGDRAALLANPDALVLAAAGVAEGRTRVAATVDGTILGFATALPHENSTMELEDLFVDPGWMRQGIATRLIADVIEYARSTKIQHIWVTANPHAYDFYRSAGFKHVRDAETPFGEGSHMELAVADDDA